MDSFDDGSHRIDCDAAPAAVPHDTGQAEQMLRVMLEDLLCVVDRPELWSAFPQVLAALPDFSAVARAVHRGGIVADNRVRYALEITVAMCDAYEGQLDRALERLTRLAIVANQLPLVQGALFHVQGLAEPKGTQNRLEGRFCTKPFEELHVLEESSHLCCASWLPESVGNMNDTDWRNVWNSDGAQKVRASIHDGSFRHCNKTACPMIQGGTLPKTVDVAARSDQ